MPLSLTRISSCSCCMTYGKPRLVENLIACEYQDANKDVDQRRRSHPDSPKAPRQYGPLEWLRRPEFYDLMAGYRGEIAKSDEDRLIRSLYKESWSAFYRTAAVE